MGQAIPDIGSIGTLVRQRIHFIGHGNRPGLSRLFSIGSGTLRGLVHRRAAVLMKVKLWVSSFAGATIAGLLTLASARVYADPMAADTATSAAEKRAIIGRTMKLTPEQEQKFWPVYDNYQIDLN